MRKSVQTGSRIITGWSFGISTDIEQGCAEFFWVGVFSHLEVRQTLNRVATDFFWSGVYGDIKRFYSSRGICQGTILKERVRRYPLGN